MSSDLLSGKKTFKFYYMNNLLEKLMFQIIFLKPRNPMAHFDFLRIFSENIREKVVQATNLHQLLLTDHLR